MTPDLPGAAGGVSPPSRFELAKFGYAEVLDATKHQDDKVGRLLAAVAFLTGGALIFAKADYLTKSYPVGAHEYHLTAIFLGAFLFFDFIAITLFVLTVATPLTFPGRASGGGKTSHLFFHVISRKTQDEWTASWSDNDLAAKFEEELIDETYNLAYRAASKYQRSRMASTFFLAAILCLIPTLVLSLDHVSDPTTTWDNTLRFFVAIPVSAFVFAFVMWEWGQARDARRRPDSPSLREWPLLILAFTYPTFVATIITGAGWRSGWARAGLILECVSGLVAAIALGYALRSRSKSSAWKKLRPILFAIIGVAIVGLAFLVTKWRHPDAQLLLGMSLAVLILADNLRPNPLPRTAAAPATAPPATV